MIDEQHISGSVSIELARELSRGSRFIVHWRPERLPEDQQYALVYEVME